MCGILLGIFAREGAAAATAAATDAIPAVSKPLWRALQHANSRRGPDGHSSITLPLTRTHTAVLEGWTLHLRGKDTVTQPIQDAHGSWLCFNGEIFGGLQPAAGRIYFGRDVLGRRSLLWRFPKDAQRPFYIASVAPLESSTAPVEDGESLQEGWEEIPADGMYCLSLANGPQERISRRHLKHVPWRQPDQPPDEAHITSTEISIPAPFVRLATTLPDPSDLLEVEPDDSAKFPHRTLPSIVSALDKLEQILAESVKARVENIPPASTPTFARLGILFSGGLDCICLAALADRFLPPGEPCDLLNVAFESARKRANPTPQKSKRGKGAEHGGEAGTATNDNTNDSKDGDDSIYTVPDRLTGLSGVAQLRARYPTRDWRFVEINIPYPDAVAARSHIHALMNPLDTEMDISIAIAFWFAARGNGHIRSPTTGEKQPYTSAAKVLFSGLGADEQLGGYSRHRTAFEKRSWAGLIEEVQTDIDRISTRNMGRDDRIVSDHGKEVRFPYLSEHLLAYLCTLPMHVKTDPRYPRGVGEKLLLRELCRRLGLVRAAGEPKRAVQFGARSAKMDVGTRAVRGGWRVGKGGSGREVEGDKE
ncbi:asparagine synthase-domain-containing protein [Fimicolochytrium jonesii]|uniref:asparagine synthase-domain-containing protein n=1 Tax=Fimicolochytrium jonesii TaxID=1396493 RepID=UPI0022FE453E|nr:asparagine synthase-domain-containing protein [Fimicolochytrium jonesii]KAI8827166.1 asparagine synthase-domain-containing protein [Fimicolochytrium jonesii]